MATQVVGACIFEPCVATWRHWHGGFPGGYDNPADPEGAPLEFEGDEPNEGVRDYNGAPLRSVTLPLNAMRCPVCGHRLDDMDGCDSCEADKDEAIRQATEGDDDAD